MKYLLLINKDEARFRSLPDVEREALRARYAAYGDRMIESGVLRAGAVLRPSETATTVRVRAGQRLITDGPFAEMAEQIAGFAVIEVDDLDAALEWAAGHPDAEWASVEIRPLVPWQPPPGVAG